MRLLHGYHYIPVRLSSTRQYIPEAIEELVTNRHRPYWLEVEGTRIEILTRSALALACEAVSAHHNAISYNAPSDDGFLARFRQAERTVDRRMAQADLESSDTDSVTSAEDMVYEHEVYM